MRNKSLIRFLSAKDAKAYESHPQINAMYKENIMGNEMLWKWVKDGQTNVPDGERMIDLLLLLIVRRRILTDELTRTEAL